MRALVLPLCVIVAFVAPSTAHAEAACFPVVLNSPPGVVPMQGTLYAFYELPWQWERRFEGVHPIGEGELRPSPEPAVRWIGPPGDVRLTRLSPMLVRVDYEGADASVLVIGNSQYTLARDWKRPPAPVVTSIEHSHGRWTCGGHDLVTFTLNRTSAAIRVRWTYEGRTTDSILVAREQLLLGSRTCQETNLSPIELRAGGELELFALAADGTEQWIAGVPRFFVGTALFPDWTREPPRDDMRASPRSLADSTASDADQDDRHQLAAIASVLLLILGAGVLRRSAYTE